MAFCLFGEPQFRPVERRERNAPAERRGRNAHSPTVQLFFFSIKDIFTEELYEPRYEQNVTIHHHLSVMRVGNGL